MINITIWGVLATISLIMMISLLRSNNEKIDFSKKAVKTTAMVERITSEYELRWCKGGRGRRRRSDRLSYVNTYTAYVSYEIEGVEYNNIKVMATSTMEEGETIEIYYVPDEPWDAKSSADLQTYFSISLVFIFIAEIIIVWSIYTDRLDFKWLEFLKGGLDK